MCTYIWFPWFSCICTRMSVNVSYSYSSSFTHSPNVLSVFLSSSFVYLFFRTHTILPRFYRLIFFYFKFVVRNKTIVMLVHHEHFHKGKYDKLCCFDSLIWQTSTSSTFTSIAYDVLSSHPLRIVSFIVTPYIHLNIYQSFKRKSFTNFL